LEIGASLELGVWNLELVAWALSFSKVGMRAPWLGCLIKIVANAGGWV
jgi:hypothetical protein